MQSDWNGRPDEPGRSGWCWIEDADGLRPLLWRGADWPDAPDRGEWQDGAAVLSAKDLAGARFLGRVAVSEAVAARFAEIIHPRYIPRNTLGLFRALSVSKPSRST